jgi:hypothetical protein
VALPVDCEGGDAVIPNVKQKGEAEAAIGQSQSSEHNFRLASANQSQSSQNHTLIHMVVNLEDGMSYTEKD